jgi:hypothetical protein
VEVDSAVCMRTGVEVDVAVDLSMVVKLSIVVGRIHSLSRNGCDLVQLSTVVGAGTAWGKADVVGASPWLGTTAPSQSG